MIGKGTVTLNGRVVAKRVLVQIQRDMDSPSWHGTLFMNPASLVEGESLWIENRYGLEMEGGSRGDFRVTTPIRVGAAASLEVQGSGALQHACTRG
jgi:hypothetical protein